MIVSNGYRWYSVTEKPLKIYGLAVADADKKEFYRLPEDMLKKMPQYDFLGRRAAGGRVRFATDSKAVLIRMTLAGAREDINIPLSGSAGADMYLGSGKSSRYLGYIAPDVHVTEEITVQKTFAKSNNMDIVTINLPRNDHMLKMEVGICEDAVIKEAPDYKIKEPIVFYGSSITEGGCASRAGNAYTSMVCRWLDADYYNYGFSGSAKGEPEFAEFIAGIPRMSLFVYDYDHNAPSVEHLQKTHEPFFRIIRETHPRLPVLMLSRPDVDKNMEDAEKRKSVICQTYQRARESGDQNVWFIDGKEFFGDHGREECTVDGTHPNTLGFMRMAERIYPVLEKILDRQ